MKEASLIMDKLQVPLNISIDQRIDGAAKVGSHKTSMLQDYERGRPMEIDALVGAVSEMGTLTRTPTPTIDRVLAEVIQQARLAGCYE